MTEESAGMSLLRDFRYSFGAIAKIFSMTTGNVHYHIMTYRKREFLFGNTYDVRSNSDFREVAAYLKAHPDATTFDVALECHFTDSAARYWIKKVRACTAQPTS